MKTLTLAALLAGTVSIAMISCNLEARCTVQHCGCKIKQSYTLGFPKRMLGFLPSKCTECLHVRRLHNTK